eukprot:TRINITY_DN44136_c0_g1_i1.p1 TRINITY_DN44136_c0_g1~~TRINITY_DN44136_c0_g1_i1.p1  ORF type:complete len:146 (-),score=7.68 TRINITY_DN44136_c0_g1_i1:26-442(-)
MCIRDRYQRRVHGDFRPWGLISIRQDQDKLLKTKQDEKQNFNNNWNDNKSYGFNAHSGKCYHNKRINIPLGLCRVLVYQLFLVISWCSQFKRLNTVSYTHLTLPTILLVQISVVAVSLKKKHQTKYTQYRRSTNTHNM